MKQTARTQRAALGEVLAGRAPTRPAFTIEPTVDGPERAEYHALRRAAFVEEQGLFVGHDRDERDGDPRLVVLVARDRSGTVLGGVRLGPVTDRDIGWWFGGRLVVSAAGRRAGGVGAALVRAACAYAETAGVLRFEAEVRSNNLSG
ncbi:MAG: MSMEG_0567/Sll0786 family nitrogen starvation N-acetyltransferase [Pseudonocardia sp.]